MNYIDRFLKIIKIDSQSAQEKRIINYLIKWLTQHQISYRIDKLGNILAKNNVVGKPILFCVHMDTVQPGKGIKPIIKDGVIKSSGDTILGADNKATLACLLNAVEKYLKFEKKPRAFELLFTVKEETGGGVEFFPFNWIKSKEGFIFDSAKPLGGIILRSPYISNFHVEIIGKACHASEPNNGLNSFPPMFAALVKIKTGKLDYGLTTINIGKINGGTGINIIPDKIKISGEMRSYDKKLFDKHLIKIEKIFTDQLKNKLLKIKFLKDGFCPGYQHNKKDYIVKKVIKIYNNLNLKPKYYFKSGISDANILNRAGIKTVNLTDGVKNPHTLNESLKIKDLEKLTKIIYSFLLSY